MKPEKKRSLIRYALLLALLAAACAIAFGQNLEQETRPIPTPTVPPSAQKQRGAREAAYDKDVESLRLLSEGGDEEAAQQLKKLVDMHQSELAIEEALEEAGMTNSFVVVYNGSVTVMVEEAQMKNSAKILALCMAHADVEAQNVRIMAFE